MTSDATDPPDRIVGIQPWFPWPLSRWKWWTDPIRAERLAALRIGLSLLLLFDVLFTLIPNVPHFFDPEGIWYPHLYPGEFEDGQLHWTVLGDATNVVIVQTVMWLWVVSLFFLLLGLFTRVSAIGSWILAVSVANVMEHVNNAGDVLRLLWLFYLMLCPCGAAWSLDSWWRRRFSWEWNGRICLPRLRLPPDERPCFVHPWPARLILFQLCVTYFFNGLFKSSGRDWWAGNALYYALGDLSLTRFSFQQFPIPIWILRGMNWAVLFWELLFPFVMVIPWKGIANWLGSSRRPLLRKSRFLFQWNREITLLMGVAFHLGIALVLELGFFSFYALCGYLPMVPWENWRRERNKREVSQRP